MTQDEFVHEAYEYLTGYFGTAGMAKCKRIKAKLKAIFKHAMTKCSGHSVCFTKEVEQICHILNTPDEDMVYSIINAVFNGDTND